MKCPHCQKDIDLKPPPLQALKMHIKGRIKSIQKCKARAEKSGHEYGIQRTQDNINKWNSWLNALESLEKEAKGRRKQ